MWHWPLLSHTHRLDFLRRICHTSPLALKGYSGQPRQGLSRADIKRFAHRLSDLGKEAHQHATSLSLHHHYNQPVMYRVRLSATQPLLNLLAGTQEDLGKLAFVAIEASRRER